MKTIHKLARGAFSQYAHVAKACSYGAVAITLAGGLGAGLASLDDDIPIRLTVDEAVEEETSEELALSLESTESTVATTEKSLKKVVTQESALEVKNQVAYVSTKTDPAVEMRVYAYFADIPEMIYVAQCESTFRHYGADGNVLRGNVVSSDVGVMQINEYYHLDRARSLGYDVHTLEGNLGYARFLYEEQGLQPWSASRPCWSSKHAVAQL
ncbi:MAG: hypothetical protein WDZ74_01815 [Candidatus Paceibacterota bacterium]